MFHIQKCTLEFQSTDDMPGCEDFGHEFLRKWSLLRGVNPPDFLGETGKRMEKSYVFALQNNQSNVTTKFARRGFRTTPCR